MESKAENTVMVDDVEQETFAEDAKGRKKRRKKAKNCIRHSMVVKVLTFFLMVACFLGGISASLLCIYMKTENYYASSLEYVLQETFDEECKNVAAEFKRLVNKKNEWQDIEAICADTNVKLELYEYDIAGRPDELLWSTGGFGEESIVIDKTIEFTQWELRGVSEDTTVSLKANELYLLRIHVDSAFDAQDTLREIALPVMRLYEYRYEMIGIAVGALLLCCICLIFLLCVAGHRNGCEGITPGVVTYIPLEIVTAIFVTGLNGILYILEYVLALADGLEDRCLLSLVAVMVIFAWGSLYFLDFSIRLKCKSVLKNTIFFRVLKMVWRVVSIVGRWIWDILCGVPLISTTIICCVAVAALEMLGIIAFWGSDGYVFFWSMAKVLEMLLVMYVAIQCKKLLAAGKAIADGREEYRVNTAGMAGYIKVHGESLNSIGNSITKAVEARMKSERMKTELITNVSHDLKTPLTSIINYAGLICEEKSENPRVAEYAEVLLRQSGRLKKLLEDLVEASKATTGNLEVNLEPCEVGVLLTQTAGEYEQKLCEKSLKLIVRQPEEDIKILADGRHLWRVFDNLLNNICKYAQEQSRVYLTLELRERMQEKYVEISFKNMSKYALDVSAEELEERFVRGDKSRNIEGNGLGLSIAKSLVELQNGKMQIVTDGDLFKVILKFKMLKD